MALTEGQINQIYLYDITGRLVLGQASGQLDVSGLNSGTYFMAVQDDAGMQYFEKVVKL